MDSTVIADPQWLSERRQTGTELSASIPLPDRKTRGWEFTDLRKFDLQAYEPAVADSTVRGGTGGVIVLPIAEAVAEYGELIEKHLGSLVPSDDYFVARNEAGWNAGTLVYVPAGVTSTEPIRLELNLDDSGVAINSRTLIVLEEGAEAEVWENYASASDETDAMLNTVVEIAVGTNAKLTYIATQDISEKSWLFSSQRAEVQRDGKLDWVALGFGGRGGKVRMTTNLAGQGSEARVTGGYASGGTQHLDFDTLQEHAAEHTFSDLAFKGVLGGKSTAVWRGMIKVDEGAQQTDAFQECRNMLLTRTAHADAIPGLEILADDVRCTHAAAIAQVDPDQLFYLESRGLAADAARSLVIEGFLQSLVERLKEGPVRDEIGELLEKRLDEILA